ncbi:hypothetical protein SRHO_G00097520 [Serrasalmus rhombeus]
MSRGLRNFDSSLVTTDFGPPVALKNDKELKNGASPLGRRSADAISPLVHSAGNQSLWPVGPAHYRSSLARLTAHRCFSLARSADRSAGSSHLIAASAASDTRRHQCREAW